jgi:hypothetical protein
MRNRPLFFIDITGFMRFLFAWPTTRTSRNQKVLKVEKIRLRVFAPVPLFFLTEKSRKYKAIFTGKLKKGKAI